DLVSQTILAQLNADLTPVVLEHGSLGASGYRATLAHCALAIIGEGEVDCPDGARRPVAEALKEAGVDPIKLGPKEGLALINGTDGLLGTRVLPLTELEHLLRTAAAS